MPWKRELTAAVQESRVSSAGFSTQKIAVSATGLKPLIRSHVSDGYTVGGFAEAGGVLDVEVVGRVVQ